MPSEGLEIVCRQRFAPLRLILDLVNFRAWIPLQIFIIHEPLEETVQRNPDIINIAVRSIALHLKVEQVDPDIVCFYVHVGFVDGAEAVSP